MNAPQEYNAEVTIENKLGFHVRPIQRFAELARAFECEVEVEIEGRNASGKSVLELMSLKGQCGAQMRMVCRGEDARQCNCILKFLAENRFFVEDQLDEELHPLRHLRRLATMTSCFDSDVTVKWDSNTASAEDFSALKELGLQPDSQPDFDISGNDADQARTVMEKLVKYRFYVESRLDTSVQGSE